MTHRSPDPQLRTALYAGTFNPFTIGHLSILRRGLELFDKVVVCVGVNCAKGPARPDIEALREKLAAIGNAEVIEWDGLTVDAATATGARWLLRGVRSVADFEYERNLADINRRIAGIETVILFAEPELAAVSSSMVRELKRFGRDVDDLIV